MSLTDRLYPLQRGVSAHIVAVRVSARAGGQERMAARSEPTHPRARAQLLHGEIDGGLVHACSAERLDDLSLPEES